MIKHYTIIPAPQIDIHFYVGEDSYLKFIGDLYEKYEYVFPENTYPGEGHGRSYRNCVWVEEWDIVLIAHELQHFKDCLFEELGMQNEPEGKAIFAGIIDNYVYNDFIENMKEK